MVSLPSAYYAISVGRPREVFCIPSWKLQSDQRYQFPCNFIDPVRTVSNPREVISIDQHRNVSNPREVRLILLELHRLGEKFYSFVWSSIDPPRGRFMQREVVSIRLPSEWFGLSFMEVPSRIREIRTEELII
jgi:hypothetical protein